MFDQGMDYFMKIVLVGDSGVGKTNLVKRFIDGTMPQNVTNTIAVDFFSKDLMIKNHSVKVQFWDTAGQEKYRAIANAYYKNAQGAIIVYEITNRESFENVYKWLQKLNEFGEKGISILLIGNKIDLAENRQVTFEEGQKIAEAKGALFFETSAKTNQDNFVTKAFDTLISDMLAKIDIEEKSGNSEILTLSHHENKKLTREKKGNVKCCNI